MEFGQKNPGPDDQSERAREESDEGDQKKEQERIKKKNEEPEVFGQKVL